MSVSVQTATQCAVSVMWMGPCQQALFVTNTRGYVALADYDELQVMRDTYGDEVIVEKVVVPGELEGECIIL